MSSNKNFFEPRARLLLQLGDRLIKNENIALLELIKNSYDADARNVKVILDRVSDKQQGTINVIDDGEGMDLEIIENVWLEPGSDYKQKKFINRERTTKYDRLPIGEKGIGRFGVHKLGNKIELVSRKKDSPFEVVVKIDWNKFAEKKYLKDAKFEVLERTPEYFLRSRTGTRITITDLRTVWIPKMVRDLYKSIFNLNSPFKKPGNFFVQLDVDDKSILKNLPTWSDIKHFSLWHFKCELNGSEITKFDYEFTPWENMHGIKPRTVTEKDDYIAKRSTIVAKSKGKKREDVIIDLSKNYSTKESPASIGPVKFEAYIFDRDRTTLDLSKHQGVSLLKNYLDEQGGISVYRDNIRINVYGEKSNDWLNLDIRRVNIPAKRISNNIILGVIDLTLEESTALVEKTNREGFIENEAFADFTTAILYVLHTVETLRKYDKDIIRQNLNPDEKEEPVLHHLGKLKAIIDKKVKDESLRNEMNEHLVKIERDYDNIKETLLMSAGAGLTLAVGVHEVQKVISELNEIIKTEDLPENILSLIRHLDDLIENYSDLLRQSSKKSENIVQLIDSALFNVDFRIKAHKVAVISAFRRNESIDVKCSKRLLLGAIINVIDNSIYWLERKRMQLSTQGEEFTKKIYIDVIKNSSEQFAEILIADNGPGFGIPLFQLTKPFISDKPEGMGLGLHIAKEVMQVQEGHIMFPEKGEYDVPAEFEDGAHVILKLKLS